jgi:hypothetical protein
MAIAGDTPVPVPGGWVLANTIQAGDYVYGSDGLPQKVQTIHQYTPHEMYLVTMSDGVALETDQHTRLPISTVNNRIVENKYKGKRKRTATQKFATPTELLDSGLKGANRNWLFSVNNTQPVQFPHEDHPVPPFIAGMWMTRRNKQSHFWIRDEVLEYVQKEIRSCGWAFVMDRKNLLEMRPNIRNSFLTRYATIPTTLPVDYYFGSIDQRIDLLRGLLVTNPGAYNKKTEEFLIHSRDLRHLIKLQGVCESLGMKTQVFENKTSYTHKLRFKTNIQLLPWQKIEFNLKNAGRRSIIGVEKTPALESIHITTEKPFVVGQGFLPIWH